MEGKKIAFIVVAIATVGGIGYYLYKKNKANALTSQNLANALTSQNLANALTSENLAKQDKLKQDFDKGKPKDLTAGRITIQKVQPRGASSVIKPSTGYFKATETE
jgi:hypothetical protein